MAELILLVDAFVLKLGLRVLMPDTAEFVALKFALKFALNAARFGLTLVRPAPIPDSPVLILVELSAFIRFMPFRSCPRFDIPLLILSDGKFELKALRGFKLGFIAVRPELMLGRLRLSKGFDVVMTLEVNEVRLVLKRDSGSPMLRPTPKVGVAGGRPIPVPELLM